MKDKDLRDLDKIHESDRNTKHNVCQSKEYTDHKIDMIRKLVQHLPLLSARRIVEKRCCNNFNLMLTGAIDVGGSVVVVVVVIGQDDGDVIRVSKRQAPVIRAS
jgi:hypothetical protein